MYVAAEWLCSVCALAEDKNWRGSSFMKPAWTKIILPELELNISYKPVTFAIQVCCIGTGLFLIRWHYFLHARSIDIASPIDRDFQNCRHKEKLLALADAGDPWDIILIIVQRDATQSSLLIILQVHSTCFGCQPHPSSGVHKTVTTVSGTDHIFCAASSLQRGQLWPRSYIFAYWWWVLAWPRWREVAAQKI